MMQIIEDRNVIIRKPHNCWGCTRQFGSGTSMKYTTSIDNGFSHSYWCNDCVEFMNTLQNYEMEDGFSYGEFLNCDEYRQKLGIT